METTSNSKTYYRYRSTAHLLGKHKELANQAIYFAEPSELNDPMEALRDYVWQGSFHTWRRLLKHYLNCLYDTYLRLYYSAASNSKNGTNIRLEGPWLQEGTARPITPFDELWAYLDRWLNLDALANEFAQVSRPVRREELETHLSNIHPFSLRIIDSLAKQIPSTVIDDIAEATLPDLDLRSQLFELSKQLDVTDEFYVERFSVQSQKLNARRLINRMRELDPVTPMRSRLDVMLHNDFPRAYLDQLAAAVTPHWFTACFTKDPGNPTMWSQYADGHKGVCLIFEFQYTAAPNTVGGETAGRDTPVAVLNLNSGGIWRDICLYDVHYQNALEPVKFFSNPQLLSSPVRLRQLYDASLDDEQTKPHNGESESREMDVQSREQLELLKDCCRKISEWQTERETRLILWKSPNQGAHETERTLSYRFTHLKGVIFGIKTSEDDKLQILTQIRSKISAAERTNFEVYQAYYSNRRGVIEFHAIDMDFR